MLCIVNQLLLFTGKSVTFANWYMSMKRKVNYTKGYVVIDPALINKVNNFVYKHFNQVCQCVFASSNKYTIALTI
jgi:hypothetical protein